MKGGCYGLMAHRGGGGVHIRYMGRFFLDMYARRANERASYRRGGGGGNDRGY